MDINTMLENINSKINNANNIPSDIKPIVLAICRGYVRETNGLINLTNIDNVLKTVFVRIEENDAKFRGDNLIFGETDTQYNANGDVFHTMSYILSSNYIKLISILTHELGHVITENNTFKSEDNKYPIIKKTTDFYLNCKYFGDKLNATDSCGFRMTDGFLEHISSKIFSSREFREELSRNGYDLKDYVYKDKRIFPSRIYDEYRACFELFNYIMDNSLFEFSCLNFENKEELIKYINKNKLNVIFGILDKSNNTLWEMKKYESKLADENYEKLFSKYQSEKEDAINLAYVLLTFYNKNASDPMFIQLLEKYVSIINEQKELPIKTTKSIK